MPWKPSPNIDSVSVVFVIVFLSIRAEVQLLGLEIGSFNRTSLGRFSSTFKDQTVARQRKGISGKALHSFFARFEAVLLTFG